MDRSIRLHALPVGVLVLAVAADVLFGRGQTVLGLLAVGPLVAANLVHRRATAVYAVLALLLAALLGAYDHQYGAAALGPQITRLAGVALAGALGLAAATLRLHGDHQLARARETAAGARDAVALVAELQRSLLTDPPDVPGLEMAARYLPAVRQAHVGGDWYDAFPMADSATVLVIGDVAGHDVAAAATMAEARGVLRGIAQTAGSTPSHVLTALDEAMRRLDLATLITSVVGLVRREPSGVVFCWSNAGHPPPLRMSAGGAVEVLERVPDLLLGAVRTAPRHDHQVLLRSGDTLVLYTDGLVERRGVPLDDGIAWLAGALPELADRPLPELCDGLLAGMSPRLDDDVAVLAVRVRA